MGDKGVSRPEFQRVTLGTMTSRDSVSSPFSPLLERPQVFRAAKESAVDGVGEERENYGATVGVGGEERDWRTSEQGRRKQTCAHTCVQWVARAFIHFTRTLFTSFVIKTKQSFDFNATFYVRYIYIYIVRSTRFLFNEISFWGEWNREILTNFNVKFRLESFSRGFNFMLIFSSFSFLINLDFSIM